MKFISTLFFILLSFVLKAQESVTTQPEMADAMRESGKIYVVVGVIAIIFIGIIVYIISMDSRLSRLEKEKEERNN